MSYVPLHASFSQGNSSCETVVGAVPNIISLALCWITTLDRIDTSFLISLCQTHTNTVGRWGVEKYVEVVWVEVDISNIVTFSPSSEDVTLTTIRTTKGVISAVYQKTNRMFTAFTFAPR